MHATTSQPALSGAAARVLELLFFTLDLKAYRLDIQKAQELELRGYETNTRIQFNLGATPLRPPVTRSRW